MGRPNTCRATALRISPVLVFDPLRREIADGRKPQQVLRQDERLDLVQPDAEGVLGKLWPRLLQDAGSTPPQRSTPSFHSCGGMLTAAPRAVSDATRNDGARLWISQRNHPGANRRWPGHPLLTGRRNHG